MQLSGIKSGEYFISVEVIYESLSGNRSLRVLSLPIQIGNTVASKGEDTASQNSKPGTKNGFIIMKAQEIIR